MPYVVRLSLFTSAPWPCLPGAPELIANQTIPFSVKRFAIPLREPFV